MPASGHMRHPFDLSCIESGEDLIQFFNKISKSLANHSLNAKVKIDGLNVSFKYVGGQFAVDRGSNKEIDVSGITIDRVEERYGKGHGMLKAITNLLTILNSALPDIKQEIKDLGLVDNPHYFLNTEYVEGHTNVTSYSNSFIAFHGVNGFYAKYKKPTKKELKQNPSALPELIRSGIEGGSGSVEVSYSQETLNKLVAKLKPHAQKIGFDVCGPVSAYCHKSIDLESVLDSAFDMITYSRELERFKGKSIRQCLQLIQSKPSHYIVNRYNKFYQTREGKKVSPYNKSIYSEVIEHSTPVESFVIRQDLIEVTHGIILMHATRLLGRQILKSMTSTIGDLSNQSVSHEGIVIRDNLFSPHPFKLTGDFIVSGASGLIAQKVKASK